MTGTLDWLTAMTSHIPNHGEQGVRYYGFYSNTSRGLRQKENKDAVIHMKILYHPPHSAVGRPEEFNWKSIFLMTRSSED